MSRPEPTGHRIAALRAALQSVGLACILLLLPLLHATDHALDPLALADDGKAAVPGLVLEMQDGQLSATLPDGADDSTLVAAMPTLAARGVHAVNLHGALIRDIRPLAQLTGLIALDAAGTQVRDIAPLTGLVSLQSINLQFTPVRDLTPLAGHADLHTLNLSGTDVRDLTPLGDLTALQDLNLAVTKIEDLSPLARLHALTSLDISGTLVSDTTPLATMAALRVLNLNGTQVTDLRPLSGLANLQRLDVGGTQVSDVRPLAELHNLHWLDLEGTQVADVAPLASTATLRFLALGGSRVRNITLPEHILAGESSVAEKEAQPTPATQDPILYWNDQTNRAIQVTNADPFKATRDLAMESLAVLDTVRSLSGKPAFLVRLPPPEGVSMRVAITAAAHTMLTHLFPDDATALDAALAAALATEPAGPARDRALAFGKAISEALVMRREEDGASTVAQSHVGTAPGQWRPTPPNFLPALDPQWATLTPFVLQAPHQFRPAGPPAPDSSTYRQARATVATLGAVNSTVRTAEQTEIAHYWSDAIGTYAPAGHWNAIASSIVAPMQLGMAAEAELFAELNVAMADACIAMADAKYTYWSWRPISAIRAGDDMTPAQPAWTPLLTTPNHPSYVSGHSTFSGAAATVLTEWFGTRSFTFANSSLPGVTRSFTSFQQAAEEAAASRVYGGIHFPFDNADGLTIGREVGAWTLGVFQQLDHDRGPYLMVGGPMDMMMAAMDKSEVVGCALDNVAPITTVTAQLDGGTPFGLPVDDQGLFTLPATKLGGIHRHDLVVAATSSTGRVSTVHVTIGP